MEGHTDLHVFLNRTLIIVKDKVLRATLRCYVGAVKDNGRLHVVCA